MNNKNVIERLVLFVIGLPIFFSVVFFLPYKNHLVLNICVIIFSTIGALEFSNMLRNKNIVLHRAESLVFGFLPALSTTLFVSFGWTPYCVPLSFLICASYTLISCSLAPEDKLPGVTSKIAGTLSVLLYPGLFLCSIVLLSGISDESVFDFSIHISVSTVLLLTFFAIVFANDCAAWLFGSLFGSKNNKVFAASPNKSLVGFIAGFLASIAVGIIAALLIPDAFDLKKFTAVPSGIILGCTTGIAASLGDLAESAIKRSSGVKDSGRVILGRGGILDCCDSISLGAPVFYVVYKILFIIQ